MERQAISLTNIASAGYNPVMQILKIEFKQGVVWQYANFPEHMWYEFLSSPSHGKYFSLQILPRFKELGFRVQ